MVDTKIKDLTEKVTGVATDEFVINDVAGGNADKRMSMDGIRIAGTQISSGTVADARLSSNVALLDTEQTFTAEQNFQEDGGQLIMQFTQANGANNSPILRLKQSRGSIGGETATQSGDSIGSLQCQGYGTSHGTGTTISGRTTELWTATAHGAKLEFRTTGNTTTINDLRLTIDQDGTADFEGNAINGSPEINIVNSGATAGFLTLEEPNGNSTVKLTVPGLAASYTLTLPIDDGDASEVLTTDGAGVLSWSAAGAGDALVANPLSQFAATTSAQLAGVISDETGTSLLVFNTSPTIVTPTIASFTNAAHDHSNAAGGAQIVSTTALSDTADIAYLNTANIFIAGNKQTMSQSATTAGLNLGVVGSAPSTPAAGDVWYRESGDGLLEFRDATPATREVVTLDNTQILTNKDIDASNNTIVNIGSAEVDHGLITGLPNTSTPVIGDFVMVKDESAVALKKFTFTQVFTLYDSATSVLTNKSIDEDGTGNAITNLDVGTIKAGSSILEAAIPFVIDGGGSEITAGIKGDVEIPFDCTIKSSRMFADQSGSIVVDIWKDTFANFAPTDADSITASAVPTITTAIKSEDTTLTGWTTTLSKGDILRWNVDSVTSIQRVTMSLLVDRT